MKAYWFPCREEVGAPCEIIRETTDEFGETLMLVRLEDGSQWWAEPWEISLV